MPAQKKKKVAKGKPMQFRHTLVLNQWVIWQFGYNPLATHKTGEPFRPLKPLADHLRHCPEGLDTNNRHYFYSTLVTRLNEARLMQRRISDAKLLTYEENIGRHTQAANEKRTRQIVWKYYQWLSLLFTEIYLDRYFHDRDGLLKSLNEYVEVFNEHCRNNNWKRAIAPYEANELNKLCLQNATGSGKTLLMHVQYLQFFDHAKNSSLTDKLSRAILITPNTNLSEQHAQEMQASGIKPRRLSNNFDLASDSGKGISQIDYTEITKLAEEDSINQLAVSTLGDQNLLFVDEAHRGMGSNESTGWIKSRQQLVEDGFAFEYSATFKEAIAAAKSPEIEEAYCKNILFDYSYHYFYEDGYGKDYRVFNLEQDKEHLSFTYFVACLLAFYQQLKLYAGGNNEFAAYNIEKPLWVFVGRSVAVGISSQEEKRTVSDVMRILQYVARVLKDTLATAEAIDRILHSSAENTGLSDAAQGDIFAGSFLYLNELVKQNGWDSHALCKDVFETVFLNAAGGDLNIAKVKGDENEILLRVGIEADPFGLINVGDAGALMKHINQTKAAQPDAHDNLYVREAEFERTYFRHVHKSSSSINILLGSKKFIDGWDCWRVSTLGLMHVGKNEGSQIIQLFGRGVRLKGRDWTLKRSSSMPHASHPKYIQYLETLNVFGVEAQFMANFKRFLQEEGLPSNDAKRVFTIPLNITHEFGKELKTLRPRVKAASNKEYDFKTDGKAPYLGDIPSNFNKKRIEIDWYARIQSLESKKSTNVAKHNEICFLPEHLAFIDYDKLYLKLERFKSERGWHNLNIPKDQIQKLLADTSWYTLRVPEQYMSANSMKNVLLWQDLACELLQKYCETYYNHCKGAFFKNRLELRTLTAEDTNFPTAREYSLTVDSSEDILIRDIEALTAELLDNDEGSSQGKKKLKADQTGVFGQYKKIGAILFNAHLYQPLLSADKNSKIHIAPVSLNESEFVFVQDLMKFVEEASEGEFYLLRNQSRGKGVGFFEAGNFYPDFMLWHFHEEKQCLAFIDPHGLQHTGLGDPKIELHTKIKEIQCRLGTDIVLNSFLVTPSRHEKIKWGKSIAELEEINVLFMYDQPDDYIARLVSRMSI